MAEMMIESVNFVAASCRRSTEHAQTIQLTGERPEFVHTVVCAGDWPQSRQPGAQQRFSRPTAKRPGSHRDHVDAFPTCSNAVETRLDGSVRTIATAPALNFVALNRSRRDSVL